MTVITIAGIINNYKQQIGLYHHMLELARQQLQTAENRSSSMEKILAERHRLMDEISSLNRQNQVWQNAFCHSAGLESFNITNIRSAVDFAAVEELSQVLKDTSQVLQQIEAVDKSIQELLNQQLSPRNRPRTSHHQAQQAYQKGSQPKD